MTETTELPESAGFVVFLPDAVRLGRWTEIETILLPFGTELLAVAPVVLSHERYIALYRNNLLVENEPDRLPARWLGPAYFELDMSVAVLLRSASEPMQAAIKRNKGKALYSQRAPGTIRGLSPVADRCLSFLHAPDDRAELRRQASVLFPAELLDGIFASPADRRLDLAALGDLRGYVGLDKERNPYDLLLRTIVRALATLAWDGRLEANPQAEAAAAAIRGLCGDTETLQGSAARTAVAEGLASRLPLVQAACPPRSRTARRGAAYSADDLENLRLLRARQQLHRILPILMQPLRMCPLDGTALVSILQQNELFLDPWEQHRLKILAAFF